MIEIENKPRGESLKNINDCNQMWAEYGRVRPYVFTVTPSADTWYTATSLNNSTSDNGDTT